MQYPMNQPDIRRDGIRLLNAGITECRSGGAGAFHGLIDHGTWVIRAFNTQGEEFPDGAFSDLAQLFAEIGLYAGGSAAGAVNVFGPDGSAIQPSPDSGDTGAKRIIILLRGNERLAPAAIDTAIASHSHLQIQ